MKKNAQEVAKRGTSFIRHKALTLYFTAFLVVGIAHSTYAGWFFGVEEQPTGRFEWGDNCEERWEVKTYCFGICFSTSYETRPCP